MHHVDLQSQLALRDPPDHPGSDLFMVDRLL
jgi:hypothetical protein